MRDKLLIGLIVLSGASIAAEIVTGVAVGGLGVMLTTAYVVARLFAKRLSRVIARMRVSVQWKIVAALIMMALLFVSVSVINFEAMNYMHDELHAIIDADAGSQSNVIASVNTLEQTQHGFLFSAAPMLALVGALFAMTLGAGLAVSVIEPVKRMGEAMRRMAAGDFSTPIAVENRDELGELAERINATATELSLLQEATLADERARALRERIAQVAAAQEEERLRISRELHDGLGPSLAVLVNRLRACRHSLRRDGDAAERELGLITQSLKGHIQEIRQLINGLRPLTLDQVGLTGAIRQEVERFASDTGMHVLSLLSPQLELTPLAEVTVLRVLQECLTNARQHSEARQVEVQLRNSGGGTELIVQDDGVGFEPLRGGGSGVGLDGMRERAELVGGQLTVRSGAGGGCRVVLFIPAAALTEAGMEAQRGPHPRPVG